MDSCWANPSRGNTSFRVLREQVLALEEGASELPWFAGCQVYPVFPGAASKCVPCHAPRLVCSGLKLCSGMCIGWSIAVQCSACMDGVPSRAMVLLSCRTSSIVGSQRQDFAAACMSAGSQSQRGTAGLFQISCGRTEF